jgi:hypothetical protein
MCLCFRFFLYMQCTRSNLELQLHVFIMWLSVWQYKVHFNKYFFFLFFSSFYLCGLACQEEFEDTKLVIRIRQECRHGHDLMVVGFTTTYTISAYRHATKIVSSNPAHGEVYSMLHYVIKFVSDLRQVGGFLRVVWFHPSQKLTTMI